LINGRIEPPPTPLGIRHDVMYVFYVSKELFTYGNIIRASPVVKILLGIKLKYEIWTCAKEVNLLFGLRGVNTLI
jgi:hypothetical protein